MKHHDEINGIDSRIWCLTRLGLLLVLLSRSAVGQQATATIPAGTQPGAVAANPVTNKIYVANCGTATVTSNAVTVIDGATNTSASVTVGTDPCALALNPVTNKIYVANARSNDVTVIDGATNATTTFSVG